MTQITTCSECGSTYMGTDLLKTGDKPCAHCSPITQVTPVDEKWFEATWLGFTVKGVIYYSRDTISLDLYRDGMCIKSQGLPLSKWAESDGDLLEFSKRWSIGEIS